MDNTDYSLFGCAHPFGLAFGGVQWRGGGGQGISALITSAILPKPNKPAVWQLTATSVAKGCVKRGAR